MSKEEQGAVLGTFEGECADANITNLNGLDITREVWEHVFDSEEYKKAIRLGHLIGFLGHPEDPNCMDFEHACIVMTSGNIDDNGIVHGSFNLVDTPVGRIVKSFIDAGVTFGISVRGAGDVIDNSVDPETFVFRGFDLVTFPAYPDSIPEFTEIAASTDAEKRKKYQAVCAAVEQNIAGLNTTSSIDIVQGQFAKQSDSYKLLDDRRKAISCAYDIADDSDLTPEEEIELLQSKLDGMTALYLQSKKDLEKSRCIERVTQDSLQTIEGHSRRKIAAMRRMFLDQQDALNEAYDDVVSSNKSLKSRIVAMSKTIDNKSKIIASTKTELSDITSSHDSLEAANRELQGEVSSLKKKVNILSSENLSYRQKIQDHSEDAKRSDDVLASIQYRLDETVARNEQLESKVSNVDAKNKKLQSDITASKRLLEEYQDAYASLYSSALGLVNPEVPVTASTSVKDMQSAIARSCNLPTSMDDDFYVDTFDSGDDIDLVTM